MVDLSRGSANAADLLPKEISDEIWAAVQEASAVMALSRQISLPGPGLTIPVITGDAAADWTAETAHAKVSRATLDKKLMTPYKLTVLEPFSKEFRRDLPGVYAELARRLPNAIAKKFDATVFGSSAPGSNFDVIGGATAVALAPHASDVKKNTYAGLVSAITTVAGNDGSLDGWALSSAAKGLLLGQVDTTGRPLLLDSIINGSAVPQLMGERVAYTKGVYAAGTPNTVGFAGEWASAVYGIVNGIEIEVSDQATIIDGTTELEVDVTPSSGTATGTVDVPNVVSLWGTGMFAIKVTAEIGFVVRNVNRFVKLTDATRA